MIWTMMSDVGLMSRQAKPARLPCACPEPARAVSRAQAGPAEGRVRRQTLGQLSQCRQSSTRVHGSPSPDDLEELLPPQEGAKQPKKPGVKSKKVVALGSCGLDYIAHVATFPGPDDKIRTEKLETHGGGNSANQLTVLARLGIRTHLVTKLGDDALAKEILDELQSDGCNTEHVLRAEGHPSAFTYIIVDRQGGTRACIHTPGQRLSADDLSSDDCKELLDDASLAMFDGRFGEAAKVLAQAANDAGVPVLVEAERPRENLDALLQHADYVVTSKHFPEAWTGRQGVGDSMLEMLRRLPRAQWLISTLGEKGSILLQRPGHGAMAPNASVAELDSVLGSLFSQAQSGSKMEDLAVQAGAHQPSPTCTSPCGTGIGESHVVGSLSVLRLRPSGDAGDTPSSEGDNAQAQQSDRNSDQTARVVVASIAALDQADVRDTTGAGDAFIGAVAYGLVHRFSPERALRLGSVVAASNCTGISARGGLPDRDALRPDLLEFVAAPDIDQHDENDEEH